MKTNTKIQKRNRRHIRIRARVSGTADRPRLAFFKSNKNIYAQAIDDVSGVTIAQASSLKDKQASTTKQAEEIGTRVAKECMKKGIKEIVFDRGGFLYTGAVKVFADAARAAGLKF